MKRRHDSFRPSQSVDLVQMRAVHTTAILERFLWARQNAAEKVAEKASYNEINVMSYMSYDNNTNLICEDVIVESRPSIG